MTSAPPASAAKRRLLDAAVAHAAERGVGDLSLRGLAEALGTSHRMLIYHFGSREGLLVEIVREVEARQRAAFAGMSADDLPADAEGVRRAWRHFADEALRPWERLFFELYGQALQGRPGTTGLLDGIVESWVTPISAALRERGLTAERAAAQARLAVAVIRGLLLDLLATGDRAGVDAALECYLATFLADLPPA
jgi:AcrR family transcriptional regulator